MQRWHRNAWKQTLHPGGGGGSSGSGGGGSSSGR